MESIVFNTFNCLEEKVDQLFRSLTTKSMMFNGLQMDLVLLLFQDPSQQLLLSLILIVALYLNLVTDTEILLGLTNFQMPYY